MPTVFHNFVINASAKAVFDAVSTPAGLAAWWSKSCSGTAAKGEEYQMDFGPGYHWLASISVYEPFEKFELTFTSAMDDWIGSHVLFSLSEQHGVTTVEFSHSGWSEPSEHFKISSYCWAMYLRLMRRYVEIGEVVDYEKRLEV